jgi:hypothetical protein
MKLYLRISVVLILMILVSFDSALPQAETKEVLQKGEESPSQKKPADTRSRNPFLLPWGVYLLSKEGAAPVRKEKATGPDTKLEEIETSPFKVRAILISDQIRLATIGPQIVAVGDKLNDETILEIKKDRVILGKGDRKRTLHLQQSPLQLTIEEKK